MIDINEIIGTIRNQSIEKIDVFERWPGCFQIVHPILHEDGDMVDIYIQKSRNEGYVRICDCGMSLMRLSYTFEINTTSRQRIFDSILINNDITNDEGEFYLESPIDMLYENILKFIGCVQKICGMRYWKKNSLTNIFYSDLDKYIFGKFAEFNPVSDEMPLPLLKVDWMLSHNQNRVFLFGVTGNEKAKSVTISLLEFQKEVKCVSVVVYENMKTLGEKEKHYLSRNSSRQYRNFDVFQEKGDPEIRQLMAA